MMNLTDLWNKTRGIEGGVLRCSACFVPDDHNVLTKDKYNQTGGR